MRTLTDETFAISFPLSSLAVTVNGFTDPTALTLYSTRLQRRRQSPIPVDKQTEIYLEQ